MDRLIKQHLLCGTRSEINEYFDEVSLTSPDTHFRGTEARFQIPTWPIQQQLDDIEKKSEPKIGFVWYFIRKILNHPNGTFDIEMAFRQEMVWIKQGVPYEPYIMQTINNLLQHTLNSNVLEQK